MYIYKIYKKGKKSCGGYKIVIRGLHELWPSTVNKSMVPVHEYFFLIVTWALISPQDYALRDSQWISR